jgi:hypothetical protein
MAGIIVSQGLNSLARSQIRIDAILTNARIGCELVVSGRNTSTLLDLFEEPFDQDARTKQMRAKADRVFAIFSAEYSPMLPAGEQAP